MRLLATSRDDDWTGWCSFFLDAVRVQAEHNLARARSILELYGELKRRVAVLTRSQYAIHALDWMFERPIFRSSDFIAATGIPAATARRVLEVLATEGILRRIIASRGRSPAVYAFPELVNRAEGRAVIGATD